jgi:hypothetical protein
MKQCWCCLFSCLRLIVTVVMVVVNQMMLRDRRCDEKGGMMSVVKSRAVPYCAAGLNVKENT